MKFEITRDLTKRECFWLDNTIKKGTIVFSYSGCTYGCVGSGMAVTLEENKAPFFEVPNDSLIPVEKLTDGIFENASHAIRDGYAKEICRPGTKECCRYLMMSPDGWECAKLTNLKSTLDKRVAMHTITATGDNCEGR